MCEDYPCCGHTPGDPCPRGYTEDVPWYCDQCGFNHPGFMLSCPGDEWDDEDEWEDDDDAPFVMEDQWLDGSYEQ